MQRWVVLVPLGVFFALPLVAMLEFTTRKPGGGRTNLRAALLSAAFISVALVLGEFTIASLLNRQNLQVAINFLAKRDAAAAITVSFAALVLAFLLLLVLSLIGRGKNRRST